MALVARQVDQIASVFEVPVDEVSEIRERRDVPFVLEGERAVVGVAHVRLDERLVPVETRLPIRRWRQ